MNKTSAIGQLRQHIDTLRDMGATGLYLFGSTARDEASGASDLDLFIDHAPDGRFSLIDLVGIKQFIEDRIAVPVDITTRNSLHPMMRTDIERSAVRIF